MPILDEATQMASLLKQFSATNFTPATNYYIAAVVNVPDDDTGAGLLEPTDPDYDRVTVPNDSTNFGLSDEGTEVVNLLEWAFPQATVDWGTVFGIALYTAGDVYQGYLPFSVPKYIVSEQTLKVPAGGFIVSPYDTPLSLTIEETLVPSIKTAPNGDRYIFSVDNSGAAVYTATTFYGPPAPPTSLTDTAGVLSWTVSAFDGGSPVVSQTIWVSTDDNQLVQFEIIDSAETSFDTDGVTGDYFVTADNLMGSSDPSNMVTVS